MNFHGENLGEVDASRFRKPPRGRHVIILAALTLALFVLVPFLFWRGTWFGRPLQDREITEYLTTSKKPRQVQHALSQVADRIIKADPSARQWYPRVVAASKHSEPQLRADAAWVMGQDNSSEEFHSALQDLLGDGDPLVRRNAALSLVRFHDPRAKTEILAMLSPYPIKAECEGTVSFRLDVNDAVDVGTLFARINAGQKDPIEIRSPLPGHLQRKEVQEGAHVAPGDRLALLSPGADHIWEALRSLYLIGGPQDLPVIESFASKSSGFSDQIQRQAKLTAEAIRNRANNN